jgi:hypothetical protein
MDLLSPAVLRHCVFVLALMLEGAACVPELDVDESIVKGPRVLAIQAEPAEAKPNELVRYRALLVDENGARDHGELSWYFCTAPKPLAELGPINQDCLTGDHDALSEIGEGLETDGELPAQACSLFGPNPPPPVGDEPPGRPLDPDQTGGFKLPVMLGVGAVKDRDILLYEQRIACGIAGVTSRVSIDFTQRYHRNENPAVSQLEITRASGTKQVVAEDDVLEVARGEMLRLAARWPDCPTRDVCGDGLCGPDETTLGCEEDCATLVGCQGQERYVWLDTQSRTLSVRRESMRAAWYATAGTLEEERTGKDEGEPGRDSTNTWTAPGRAGTLHLWVVLRDARGGVGFRALAVRVR